MIVVLGGNTSWRSNAPMSEPSPPLTFGIPPKSLGRGRPRWSVVSPALRCPRSIAGLPGSSACVFVGPPLNWSGPSLGITPAWSVGLVKPQLGIGPGSDSRLNPFEVEAGLLKQLAPPPLGFEMSVFAKVLVGASLMKFATPAALLPVRVELRMLIETAFANTPPA